MTAHLSFVWVKLFPPENAFDIDLIAMFEELLDDIAYEVVNLRIKAARVRAEESLLASQAKLSGILASIDNVVRSATAESFLTPNRKQFNRMLPAVISPRFARTPVLHADTFALSFSRAAKTGGSF